MSALAWLTCKAFIESQPSEKQKQLLSFLPTNDRQFLAGLPTGSSSWIDQPVHVEDALDIAHPSWIEPLLKSSSSQELGFYLASLRSNQTSALKTLLRYLRPLPALSPLGKTFLRNDLLKKLVGNADLLPLEALPPSQFLSFVRLPFRDITRLAYLLGLRDLGHYLRLVIDKTILKNIENALSPSEWKIVQRFAAKKDPLAAGRSGFETWRAEKEKLRSLIEQRGINRLAKALFGEDPSLIWYITHILDVPRANFFTKLCVEVSSPETQDLLREQVFDTLKMLPEQPEIEEQ